MKKEISLKQMIDKYHTHISPIEEKKRTQLETDQSAKIISNLNHQTQSKSQIHNSNEPRHKNLEKMLKKLNTEQEIDYLNKTSSNHDSFYSANQHVNVQLCTHCGNNGIINRSHQQDSNHESILAYLKKSKRTQNTPEHKFQQTTDTLILKQSFTSVLNTKLIQPQLNSPSIVQSQNNSNALNNSLYFQTSFETSNIVQSIDSRIKELKMKFLRDTHIDIIKLSKYQNTLLTLISFLQDRDIKELYHSCTKANQIIRAMINSHCKQYIVDPFIAAYNKCFRFQRCLIVIRSSKTQGKI